MMCVKVLTCIAKGIRYMRAKALHTLVHARSKMLFRWQVQCARGRQVLSRTSRASLPGCWVLRTLT